MVVLIDTITENREREREGSHWCEFVYVKYN